MDSGVAGFELDGNIYCNMKSYFLICQVGQILVPIQQVVVHVQRDSECKFLAHSREYSMNYNSKMLHLAGAIYSRLDKLGCPPAVG